MQKKRGKTNVGECSGFLYMQGVKSKPNQKRRYKKKDAEGCQYTYIIK